MAISLSHQPSAGDTGTGCCASATSSPCCQSLDSTITLTFMLSKKDWLKFAKVNGVSINHHLLCLALLDVAAAAVVELLLLLLLVTVLVVSSIVELVLLLLLGLFAA